MYAYISDGMFSRRSRHLSSVKFHNVIIFQCYFLYFYTLLATYTEIKYQLKQYFYFFNMNIKYDELFLQNGVSPNHVSMVHFSYIHAKSLNTVT